MNAIDIKSSIDRDGYALLRGVLPAYRVVQYREALEDIYRGSEGNGDISGREFFRRSKLKIDALFMTPLLAELADSFLVRHSPFNSTFMSVSVDADNSSRGLCLHTDGIIQGTRESVLCMWAPLHPCGVDAPGIAVAPAGKARVLEYLRRHFPGKEIPGWHSADDWNSTAAFTEAAVTAEFGDVFKPPMAPGDAMLFTNHTIHGSHITSEMKRKRSAAIYRLSDRTLLQRIQARLGRHLA